MYLWLSEPKEIPEATWEEYSLFYRDLRNSVTLSEYDRKEKVLMYAFEQDIPQNEINDFDFTPMNFLSAFYIKTHQGINFI